MNFAIYDTATGRISRIVSCPENLSEAQLGDGESLLADPAGLIRDDTHAINAGVFVELPPPPEPPPPTETEIRGRYVAMAQLHMDDYARTWGYDDIRSAVSYVGDPFPRFNAEGVTLRDWRSAVWAYLDANQDLPDPLPTEEEFLALLPEPPERPQ
jgi:hypothetical protein